MMDFTLVLILISGCLTSCQELTIEGAEGRSPAIRGNGYGPVICKSACRPGCGLEWRRDNTVILSDDSTYELVLIDRDLPRRREVTYTCKEVQSDLLSTLLDLSTEESITVQVYFSARITGVEHHGDVSDYFTDNIRYLEGSMLQASVYVDSNPGSDVSLLRDRIRVAVGVLLSDGYYEIRLENLQCNHTGVYDVSASNHVTRITSSIPPSLWQFNLQISCTPRRETPRNNIIGVAWKGSQSTALNVTLISNPMPTFTWSNGVTSLPVQKINDYRYNIRGSVDISGPSEFQKHTVNVFNDLQEGLTVTFQIREEGVPDQPTEFRAVDVGQNDIKIEWISGFDGGYPQLFHIYTKLADKEWIPAAKTISDSGQGMLIEHTLVNLITDSEYTIRLDVSNERGPGKSVEIKVKTLEDTSSPIEWKIIVPAVTVGLTIIIIIIIILVIRRKRVKKRQKQNRYRTNNQQPQSSANVDEGQKQNRYRTNNQQPQSRANVDEEVEHIYATTEDVASDNSNNMCREGESSRGVPVKNNRGQEHVNTENRNKPKQSVIGRRLPDIADKCDGADDQSEYTDLDQSGGQEHVYTENCNKPKRSMTGGGADDQSEYTDLDQSGGQEHVYTENCNKPKRSMTGSGADDQSEYTDLDQSGGPEHVYTANLNQPQHCTNDRGLHVKAANFDSTGGQSVYTDLDQSGGGHEHVYTTDINHPQLGTTVGGLHVKATKNDQSDYTDLNQFTGQEHVYTANLNQLQRGITGRVKAGKCGATEDETRSDDDMEYIEPD